MKKLILIGIIVLFADLVIAYTPPDNLNVELVLDTDYTPPDNLNINLILSDVITDSCSCPSSGDWHIIDGDECSLSTVCNIGSNKFRVLDGKMRINSGGFIRAGGCFVADTHSLYIDENGGLYCEG